MLVFASACVVQTTLYLPTVRDCPGCRVMTDEARAAPLKTRTASAAVAVMENLCPCRACRALMPLTLGRRWTKLNTRPRRPASVSRLLKASRTSGGCSQRRGVAGSRRSSPRHAIPAIRGRIAGRSASRIRRTFRHRARRWHAAVRSVLERWHLHELGIVGRTKHDSNIGQQGDVLERGNATCSGATSRRVLKAA